MISRKEFIRNSGLATASLIIPSSPQRKKPKLSFSTLGCPDWPFDKILSFAKRYNYSALEIRGIEREMNMPASPLFNSKEAIATTLKKMEDHGLSFINLGSGATLHFADEKQRIKNIDEGKAYIDLAAALDCPYIRVFPNNFPKEQTHEQTINLVSKGLLELAEYANHTNVKVLMETHGDFVKTADLVAVMQNVKHAHAGLVWDCCNMYVKTKEGPQAMYDSLREYIYHIHVKDAILKGNDIQYIYFGDGEIPILKALRILQKNNYKGYYSFEWEKLWHPNLPEPEYAFADFSNRANKFFRTK